jgi:hypothetical protein
MSPIKPNHDGPTQHPKLCQKRAAELPDYAALSSLQPLTVKEIQCLLSDGEALVGHSICGFRAKPPTIPE